MKCCLYMCKSVEMGVLIMKKNKVFKSIIAMLMVFSIGANLATVCTEDPPLWGGPESKMAKR